jgi:hypothetical protein
MCTGLAVLIAIVWGSFVASSSDASGYVSQADLMRQGTLSMMPPSWAVEAPWGNAIWTASPLGYRRQPHTRQLAPTYPPGLSLAMAGFQLVGGRQAVFLVVPLFGALAVFATYRLGRAIAGDTAGGLASALLVTSPGFLWMLVQPMSDVPAMACWTVALLWACRRTPRSAAGAGAMVGAAIVIRPNLVPLAAIPFLLVVLGESQARWKRLAAFVLSTVPAILGIVAMNTLVWGGPLQSGYGSLSDVFAWENVVPNLRIYSHWLLESETPLIAAGLLAPVVLTGADRDRVWLVAVAFPLLTLALYLPHGQYDEWTTGTRYLLPAFPCLLVGAASVGLEAWRRARAMTSPVARAALALLLVGVVGFRVAYARSHHVFEVEAAEQRYLRAADYATAMSPRSVFVSVLHSGSIHHYSGRDVLRWELLAPSSLDGAVGYLRQRGHDVYLVADPGEVEAFGRHFDGMREAALLDTTRPIVIPGEVRVYPLGGTDEPPQYAAVSAALRRRLARD